MFSRIKQQCDVTTYADAYYSMQGQSPYASGNRKVAEGKT